MTTFSARIPTIAITLIMGTLLATGPARGELQLGSPFTDHMVLQREMPVPVWGKDEPGSTVTVDFAGQQKTAIADADGKWSVRLEPLEASFQPGELKATSSVATKPLVVTDVLVGDVWICSGQSNMQMTVKAVPKVAALIPKAKSIRSFEVKRTVAFTEQETCEGQWSDRYPDSAVAFSFAHDLQRAADVPVGIILTCWGSSSIEAWMPRDMTETVPHFKTVMEEFDANTGATKKIKAALAGPKPWGKSVDIFLRRQPNILYNAMMSPLAPYACRGIVWYQGERNTQSMWGMPKKGPWYSRNGGMLSYGDVLQHWIRRYRKQWDRDDMHFLIVMLPGFGKTLDSGSDRAPDSPDAHSWAWMRESQLKALQLPHTSVANTIDLGHIKDIHPKDKRPIGTRLALFAARDTLGLKIMAAGPKMKRVETAGETLVVHFENASGLKTADNKPPTSFWVAADADNWFPAQASIVGETVVLKSDQLEHPLFVRYAFAGKPQVNLINDSELPAYPFRTENFQPTKAHSNNPAHAYRIDSQRKFDELRTSSFKPGDIIQLKRGERFQGMFAPKGSGTEQAPIILKAYGRGPRPRIDAGGKHLAGLLLRNVAHWEVNGLEITNTDGSEEDQGDLFGVYVLIEGKNGSGSEDRVFRHIHLDDCEIHDVNGLVAGKRRGGIHVHIKKCKATRIDDLRITNNRIVRVGGVGIGNYSSCARVEIRPDDEVTHNLWTNVYVAGNHVDQTGRNNIIARVSKDAIYEHNTLANSSRYDTGHSIFCFNTDGIRIQHNEAYGNVGDDAIDRGGFDADFNCINTFIQYNYSHDNMWFCGIMKRPNRNVVIRYNISENERKGLYFYGFDKERDAENIHIYNNTHFTRKGLKVRVFPQGRTPRNTRFENNIFYFEGKGLWGKRAPGVNTSFDNNLYFNISPRRSDSNAIVDDPRFVRPGRSGTDIELTNMNALLGYRLQKGSPAISGGKVIVSTSKLLDFFGVGVGVGVGGKSVNIGAVE